MFRRRRRDAEPEDAEQAGPLDAVESGEPGTAADGVAPEGDGPGDGADGPAAGAPAQAPARAQSDEPGGDSERPDGPWDASEAAPDDVERFDLGGIRLVVPDGAEVQLDVTPDGMVVPTVFVGDAAVQISAFAAPRRNGIWAEVRTEIAEGLREAGGEVAEHPGPFGVELRGAVPVQLPDGSVAFQAARFVGVDGPRWFLRGLFTGAAAEPGAAVALEEAFRGTVVVRGTEAMAPRDPLPVTVPQEILDAAGAAEEDVPGIDPFERGPEITEVR